MFTKSAYHLQNGLFVLQTGLSDCNRYSASDIRNAITSELTDYEDAVMTETALRSGMKCIVTRNVKDYRKSPVPVYTPAEFIELLT